MLPDTVLMLLLAGLACVGTRLTPLVGHAGAESPTAHSRRSMRKIKDAITIQLNKTHRQLTAVLVLGMLVLIAALLKAVVSLWSGDPLGWKQVVGFACVGIDGTLMAFIYKAWERSLQALLKLSE